MAHAGDELDASPAGVRPGAVWHPECGLGSLPMGAWVLIDEQVPIEVELDDDLVVDPSILGWDRRPEGLCRGDVCIPVDDDGPLDLERLAELLQRPVAIDHDHRVAAISASAGQRADELASQLAPDFELPDLDGNLHRLSDHRGRKVVLYAYASW